MNKRMIGRLFEEEAFEILKNKFDKVEWLSENSQSLFDFKCYKNSQPFFGEAKFTNSNLKLKYSQRNADFIIAKIKGNIIFLLKGEFQGKVSIDKKLPENVTDVQIYREDLKKLKDLCRKSENFRDKLHEILQEKK